MTEATKWTEKYQVYSLTIATGMTICCAWPTTSSEKGYGVSFCGRTLIKRFESIEEAKSAGIRLAKRVLESAAANLAVYEAAKAPAAQPAQKQGEE